MRALNKQSWFNELLADHDAPCVSIYVPHRSAPPAQENAIRYKNLLNQADTLLRKSYSNEQAQAIRAKLDEGLSGGQYFTGGREAIAIFASADYDRVVELERPVDELVIVSDSFHVKPLIRAMQQGERFHLLAVSLNHVRFFEGSQYRLDEIKLNANVPRSIFETGEVAAPKYQGGTVDNNELEHQSHKPASDADHKGVDHFFRNLDRAIWENYSRKAQLPLIVAADAQHLSDFISMSKNQYLLDTGIAHNPESGNTDVLHKEALKLIEPRFRQEVESMKDQFNTAKAQQLGSDDLPKVAEAVVIGRVGTLLVNDAKQIPGILDRASGRIQPAGSDSRGAEDVLDDLAELVLRMDGRVYLVPPEQMPTDGADVAAVFRY